MSLASEGQDAFPQSVEEAGALLGACITTASTRSDAVNLVYPAGMHPAFAVVQEPPVATEMMVRLFDLRALLRSVQGEKKKVVAAPSILQVLKKLLGLSTRLGVAANSAAATTAEPKKEEGVLVLKNKYETPPLLSTPCRKLWVDCVVLCFSLATNSGSDLTQFVRQMLVLASVHPRSAKAAGGVRIAALEVIAALFEDGDHNGDDDDDDISSNKSFALASQLAPWSLDVLQVCLKALKSAGNGEPTYRQAALQAACSSAIASRNAAWKNRRQAAADPRKESLLLIGALEDKAIAESIKVLRQAANDKFPEIRSYAANFAALLAPILLPFASSNSSITAASVVVDPLVSLEEILQLCLKNLDDDSPYTADHWAEATSRCISTAIQYHEHTKLSSQMDNKNRGDVGAQDTAAPSPRFGGGTSRKFNGVAHSLTTVEKALKYLVDQFVDSGGEFVAGRLGGSSSSGGRAVRLGYCSTITRFLRFQFTIGVIGESRSLTIQAVILSVLDMLGGEMKKQLEASPGESNTGPLFGGNRICSKADVGLVRLSTSRVLRHALSEMVPEPIQLNIFQELIALLPGGDEESTPPLITLNANQLQVVLIEISHLIATLGEAVASKVDDTVAKLTLCLSHEDNGVRFEAATACVSLVTQFPFEGRRLLKMNLAEMSDHLEQIVSSFNSAGLDKNDGDRSGTRRLFGLGKDRKGDSSKQCTTSSTSHLSIHGKSLMVSTSIHKLVTLPGSMLRDDLVAALSVAEALISIQFHEKVTSLAAVSVCFCVRAGFCIISGILATGPNGVESLMPPIFELWQKATKAANEGGLIFSLDQDLVCIDSILASIVSFLKFCSELLLTVPQALNNVTVLLEETFPLLRPKGRFGSAQPSVILTARLESATASLLEAFAWLPSGSFPMIADDVFSFASARIEKAVTENVPCSILYSLVTKEDSILDSKTLCRANREGQVRGAQNLEETIISLTAEIALHNEREGVIHLHSDHRVRILGETPPVCSQSCVLEDFASDFRNDAKAPTPLHEVGTWRRPQEPSCSSKVRTVDAAIQAFSATFGLKDGKEQQDAMKSLENLLPPMLSQLTRTIKISATSSDNDRRGKGKDDSSAVANITAVLLSCLQALPLHEATHNVPIGLGPPWMNTAKDLLLVLLPSASTIVRRGAAEGLALLATLGVTEDAHFLQSSLLHSLDEVMHGNKPDGKARPIAFEPVSAARAGSLLTLACIQRTAHNVSKRKSERARGRIIGSQSGEAIDKSNENLPLLQMMTRMLPSAACHGFKDFFVVKAYALHSFAILIFYSARLNSTTLADEDLQLLRKAVELVESNFTASWIAASADIDRGQEAEKLSTSVAFLAVILRFMTYLLPHVASLQSEDRNVARRFSIMATIILDCHGFHPVIALESMAFFEVLAAHQSNIPSFSRSILYTENPVIACIPSMLSLLKPTRPTLFAHGLTHQSNIILSGQSMRAVVYVIGIFSKTYISVAQWSNMKLVSLLLASLEIVSGSNHFKDGNLLRSAAASRESERSFAEGSALENEIIRTVLTVLVIEPETDENDSFYLRWLLLARHLLSSSTLSYEIEVDESIRCTQIGTISAALAQAASDVSLIYKARNPIRWQVKCLCAQIGVTTLLKLSRNQDSQGFDMRKNPNFDLDTAKQTFAEDYRRSVATNGLLTPCSRIVFHLEDLISSACIASVATMDQAELRMLQEASMGFQKHLIECFGPITDPEDPATSILTQFSTQVFSSIKHALSAWEGNDLAMSSRLFVAGCEVLHSVVETKLTSDSIVLKRLFRPIALLVNDLQSFKYEMGCPINLQPDIDMTPYVDTSAVLAVRVANIWTLGKFTLPLVTDDWVSSFESITSDLVPDKLALAIHSAACAIDGCRLLRSAKLSLVGCPSLDRDIDFAIHCGFFYRNEADIDDFVKDLYVRTWPSCSSHAIQPLLSARLSKSPDEIGIRDMCSTWIDKLVLLSIAAVLDGINALVGKFQTDSVIWVQGVDVSLTMKECLRGLSLVAKDGLVDMFDQDVELRIGDLVVSLLDNVWLPLLKKGVTFSNRLDDESMLRCVCTFVQSLAESNNDVFHHRSSLVTILLQPLKLFQSGDVKLTDYCVEIIIETCLVGIGALICRGCTSIALVKTMLHLVLANVVLSEDNVPQSIREAGEALLIHCMSNESLSRPEQQRIANSLIRSGSWKSWTIVALVDDGALVAQSLDSVHATLIDFERPETQITALSSIRSVLQPGTTPASLVGNILYHLGADILGLLHQYGVHSIPDNARAQRTVGCAEAMKIILVAYQHLTSNDSNKQVLLFLSTLFGALLGIIRYNGLPNHVSPEIHNDPTIGRMCSQAILHVARTTPVPFKDCVATLGEHERALLEFAVRAEMSGGVSESQQQEPTKKKLNLNGFKK